MNKNSPNKNQNLPPYYISSSNMVVQHALTALDVAERKLLAYILYPKTIGTMPNDACTLSVKDVCKIIGIKYVDITYNTIVASMLEKFMNKSFWFTIDNDCVALIMWLDSVTFKSNEIITIKLGHDLMKYVFDLLCVTS